jgi:hypothetical protein
LNCQVFANNYAIKNYLDPQGTVNYNATNNTTVEEVEINNNDNEQLIPDTSFMTDSMFLNASQSQTEIININIARTINSHKKCFICGNENVDYKLFSITLSTIIDAFCMTKIYIPKCILRILNEITDFFT